MFKKKNEKMFLELYSNDGSITTAVLINKTQSLK